jgi:hypothetical protein
LDAVKCAKGLEALREYKAEWDDDLRTFRKTPLHNWASHAADAWRYLSVAWREPIHIESDEQERRRKAEEAIAALLKPRTWNDVLRLHDEEQSEIDPDYQPVEF